MIFRFSGARLFVCLLALPFAASVALAQPANPQLTGSVAYRERIALPSDAVIDVQLLDTSVADVASQTVAEVLINAEGRQVPVAFTLAYDPAKIVPADRYSVRASIRSGDGMLMFSTTQAYPVITHGAPSKVNLILHTVGHGAHPGAAKTQAAPAAETASQTAPTTTETAAAQPEQPTPAPPTEQAPAQPQPSRAPSSAPLQDDTGISSKPVAVEANSVPKTNSTIPEGASAGTTPEQPSEAASPSSVQAESAAAPPSMATEPAASEKPTTSNEPSSNEPSTEASAPQSAAPVPESAASTAVPSEPSPASPAAAPESESSSRPSRLADAQPTTPEQTTPSEPKAESTAPLPEAPSATSKPAKSEAPLPDSPSASKRAELAAANPDTDEAAPDSASPPAPNKALTPLADTQWKLVQLEGLAVVTTLPQKPVTLAFSPEGRRIAGSAGCNSYLGTFTDDHGRLQLHPGGMTMMSCPDPAGSREQKFVAMLRSADGYKLSGDFLLLTHNGKTVAKFRNNTE